MSSLIPALKAKMLESTKLLQQLASDRSRNAGRSPDTEHDYLRLAQTLLTRAKTADGGLFGAVSDTRRPTTFQKRIAALRTHALPCGLAYGLGVYVVMSLVVLPLSAAGSPDFRNSAWVASSIAMHLLIGVLCALAARRALR